MTSLLFISYFAQSGLNLGGAPSSVASTKDHLAFLQICESKIREQEEGAEEDDEVRRRRMIERKVQRCPHAQYQHFDAQQYVDNGIFDL